MKDGLDRLTKQLMLAVFVSLALCGAVAITQAIQFGNLKKKYENKIKNRTYKVGKYLYFDVKRYVFHSSTSCRFLQKGYGVVRYRIEDRHVSLDDNCCPECINDMIFERIISIQRGDSVAN